MAIGAGSGCGGRTSHSEDAQPGAPGQLGASGEAQGIAGGVATGSGGTVFGVNGSDGSSGSRQSSAHAGRGQSGGAANAETTSAGQAGRAPSGGAAEHLGGAPAAPAGGAAPDDVGGAPGRSEPPPAISAVSPQAKAYPLTERGSPGPTVRSGFAAAGAKQRLAKSVDDCSALPGAATLNNLTSAFPRAEGREREHELPSFSVQRTEAMVFIKRQGLVILRIDDQSVDHQSRSCRTLDCIPEQCCAELATTKARIHRESSEARDGHIRMAWQFFRKRLRHAGQQHGTGCERVIARDRVCRDLT